MTFSMLFSLDGTMKYTNFPVEFDCSLVSQLNLGSMYVNGDL